MSTRLIATERAEHLQQAFPPQSRLNATCAVEMAPSISWVKGRVLGMITASKKCAIYANGNSDGTEVAEVIAAYAGATDADGRVFLGTDIPQNVPGISPEPTLECYYGGIFDVDDLTGIDSGAIADFKARLILGGQFILIPS